MCDNLVPIEEDLNIAGYFMSRLHQSASSFLEKYRRQSVISFHFVALCIWYTKRESSSSLRLGFLMDIRRIKEFNSDANIQTQLRASSKKYFSKLEIKYNEELYIF